MRCISSILISASPKRTRVCSVHTVHTSHFFGVYSFLHLISPNQSPHLLPHTDTCIMYSTCRVHIPRSSRSSSIHLHVHTVPTRISGCNIANTIVSIVIVGVEINQNTRFASWTWHSSSTSCFFFVVFIFLVNVIFFAFYSSRPRARASGRRHLASNIAYSIIHAQHTPLQHKINPSQNLTLLRTAPQDRRSKQ